MRRLVRLPKPGRPVRFGSLRRTTPISNHWGFDRGTPVDRYYIERFFEEHRGDIHGRVLEVMDARYTERFGAGVERSDVLDIDPANTQATIVADLSKDEAIEQNGFDCFILTQTLQLIYEFQSAIRTARGLLRAGGVLLATVPAVSKVADEYPNDFWRFTAASCERVFGDVFGAEHVTVQAYGNVLAAVAFLEGLAEEELSRRELDELDARFPVILGVRALKPGPATHDPRSAR